MEMMMLVMMVVMMEMLCLPWKSEGRPLHNQVQLVASHCMYQWTARCSCRGMCLGRAPSALADIPSQEIKLSAIFGSYFYHVLQDVHS